MTDVRGQRSASKARRRSGRIIGLLVVLAVLAGLLGSCPSNRDGLSGQLYTAKDETQSGARSAALALQMWTQHRSTGNLTAVQVADARDQVEKAYSDIATLEADNPADLSRQALLTQTLTDLIATLNAANATLRGVAGQPSADALREQLLGQADALDRSYR